MDKKPGVVKKITKITFTIGPIKQEDLSTPELNKLMAMAQRFDINFDTVPILDSDQTDKLGYVTLPFEIRSQEYLLVLYDRLSNLKLNPQRDVSVKFPEEFKKHIEEVRAFTAEQRRLKQEQAKQKLDLQRRSLYATYVDKDTGKDSLTEKFPEAKTITVSQHNFQWFGILEFESQEKALEVLKSNSEIEIEGQKVKIVRNAPNYEEEKKKQLEANKHNRTQSGNKRPFTSNRGGGAPRGNQGPRPLLNVGRGGYGGGGYAGNYQASGGMGRYQDYGGSYGGGYNQGYNSYQVGAKRKSDYQDYAGAPKKPYGNQRGGYGGGRGGWSRF